MSAVRVRGAQLVPGCVVRRWDTGELLYEVVSVVREDVHNPEAGRVVPYVRADCRHVDGGVRPHYWLPLDEVLVEYPEARREVS